MQIVGIDYDDNWLRCGRIQNTDKPEFVKQKQFAVDKKGVVALDAWLDECCGGDRANLGVALILGESNGEAIAEHMNALGYPVFPITASNAFKQYRLNRGRKSLAEVIAAQAAKRQQHWKPLTKQCLSLRSALFDREIARVNLQQNQARNASYTGQAFDFLMKLTQNAVDIHADRLKAADDEIVKIINKNAPYKNAFNHMMTIPGMTKLAAQSLVFFFTAYPAEKASKAASCLGLDSGSRLSLNNYRNDDVRVVRSPLYAVAKAAIDQIPSVKALAERMAANGKSEKSIVVAAMHKIVVIAYAMVKNEADYHA